ncbi:HNH endonuclease [Blautia schinkii]|nr:HNH endonuclease [Blautia schinkii]
MRLPTAPALKTEKLSRLFSNMSECYKLFWFQALINKVKDGKTVVSYDELINEMIADAWYMVSEYKLNLGPADTLEALVHYVFNVSNFKSSEKKEHIIRFLEASEDRELLKMKRTLTYNVPYRLQAPFIEGFSGDGWNVSTKALAEKINRERHVIYYFTRISGLQSQIEIKEEWAEYIKRNYHILCGWIQFHLITYLQKRNPSVPGIVNKLEPPIERKLDKVKKYWKLLLEIDPVHEIYTGQLLTGKDMSIDHFVPWSYVAHDEFWNLHPTTKSINSKKSNQLPDWNKYFPLLSGIEYYSYQRMWEYEKVYAEFEKLQNEHVNSLEVRMKLYRQGLTKQEFTCNLEEVILPVYQAAEHLGFQNWVLE